MEVTSRFLASFLSAAILAIIAAAVWLGTIIPPGEGSFGLVKVAPLIFILLVPLCFCLIWFPANLIAWFSPSRGVAAKSSSSKLIVSLSGVLFGLAIFLLGWHVARERSYRIHFYYQVQDQFGQPVSGASIRRHNNWQSSAGDTQVEADTNGLFEIACNQNESFSLNPRKEGYVLASLNGEGAWSKELWEKQRSAHGTNRPTVIKMWKPQGAEPLVGIGKEYKLPYTNAPLRFDLIAGKQVSEGGDLEITINRPDGIVSQRHPQPWSLNIVVNRGGIQDAAGTERITYFAPEEGYATNRTILSSERFRNGGVGGFRTCFYVKSRDGQVYSRLFMDFGLNENPGDLMYIELRGIANTNYSRNWEGASGTYLTGGFL